MNPKCPMFLVEEPRFLEIQSVLDHEGKSLFFHQRKLDIWSLLQRDIHLLKDTVD